MPLADFFVSTVRDSRVFLAFSLLAISALWIWLRDLAWVRLDPDSWMCVFGLAILYYLGRPWALLKQNAIRRISKWTVLSAFVIAVAGVMLNATVLLALAWAIALDGVFSYCIANYCESVRRRLWIFAWLAFPWLILDGGSVGWAFRYSGAWSAAEILNFAGWPAVWHGVHVYLGSICMEVDVDCAGLRTLQAMLLLGGALVYQDFKSAWGFYGMWGMIAGFAWCANVGRILLIALLAIYGGQDLAMGVWHEWGGVIAVAVMFALMSVFIKLIGHSLRAS